MQRRRGPVRDHTRRVGSAARGGGLEGPLEASEAAMDPPPAPKDQTRPATYWPHPHLLLPEPSSASALCTSGKLVLVSLPKSFNFSIFFEARCEARKSKSSLRSWLARSRGRSIEGGARSTRLGAWEAPGRGAPGGVSGSVWAAAAQPSAPPELTRPRAWTPPRWLLSSLLLSPSGHSP